MTRTLCCDDIAVHSHDGGKTFRKNGEPHALRWSKTWAKPRVTAYIAAPPRRLRIVRNRYGTSDGPGVTIGIALHVGKRVLGVTWAHPHSKGYTPADPS